MVGIAGGLGSLAPHTHAPTPRALHHASTHPHLMPFYCARAHTHTHTHTHKHKCGEVSALHALPDARTRTRTPHPTPHIPHRTMRRTAQFVAKL